MKILSCAHRPASTSRQVSRPGLITSSSRSRSEGVFMNTRAIAAARMRRMRSNPTVSSDLKRRPGTSNASIRKADTG
ncbi:hypothetical protein [Burkholderia anthinoferrum]|uniref:hypothetical protein n=1 Tax=Burkholderia anthinoferrum TaxID=3090833 RepID=UPI0011B09845|nr:hypothetical protein [Burkholderia anthinoferrum]